MPIPPRLHQVAVLALPGVLALDFGIPVHAFGNWTAPVRDDGVHRDPWPRVGRGAPALLIEHGLEALADADTIVVPSQARPVPPSEQVRAALATAAARGTRMVSICTGRSCSLPRACSTAARHHPLAADRRAGSRLSSGDGGSGRALRGRRQRPDLGRCGRGNRPVPAHHPHRRRGHGRQPARAGPRRGTASLRWPGPVHRRTGPAPAHRPPRRTARVALRHLDEPLSVDQMAREACLSRRTLIRRFHDETGLPPMQSLLSARIDRARELLEASDAPMGIVPDDPTGTPANLRTLFKRHTGVPPSAYRSTFHAAHTPLTRGSRSSPGL